MFNNRTYHILKWAGLLSAGLLLGPACTKLSQEVALEEPVPVSFSTYALRNASKAGSSYVAPGEDFVAGSQISVFAFYHDNTTFAAENTTGTNNADFMYNQLVTKNVDGNWEYSPVKYWPNESGASATSTEVDKLSFWGYYPRNAAGLNLFKADGVTPYDNVSNGLPKIHFTASNDISAQVDLMFAEPIKDIYKNDDAHHGAVTNGEVSLIFKHALSLVQFRVVSDGASLPNDATVVIKSMTLSGIKSAASCADPSASIASEEDALAYWVIDDNDEGSDITLPADSEGAVSVLLLVPQTLARDGVTTHAAAKLSMTYDIKFPAADNRSTFITYSNNSVERFLWSDASESTYGVSRWLPGRKYVYNIEAGLERIEFSEITEMSWTDELPDTQ